MKKGVHANSHLDIVVMENLSMSKRSQVTIFIILAVMLVAAGGIAFFMTQQNSPLDKKFSQNAEIQAQYDSLTSQIYTCLSDTYLDSLEVVGFQGGYYTSKPAKIYDFGWGFVPYYYYEGDFLMPTTLEIQNELNTAVDDNLLYCFDEIDRGNFDISYSSPKTKSEIKLGAVSFKTDLSIKISQESDTINLQLKDHPLEMPSKFYEMIQVANFIYQSHKEDPYMISFSTLVDMGTEKELFIDLRDFEEDTTLYVITYNSTVSQPSIFEFLAKYKKRNVVGSISPTL